MVGRSWLLLILVAAASALISSPANAAAQTDAISWLSTGDSYSSGEGVRGNEGDCAQAKADAWGPRAAQFLREDHEWEISEVVFTACTGHLAEDLFHPTPSGSDSGKLVSLWDWGATQPGFPEDGRFDVITMSFGGNDIGFSDVLYDCLAAPLHEADPALLKSLFPHLSDAPDIQLASAILGMINVPVGDVVPFLGDDCDVTEAELRQRIDWLFDPVGPCGDRSSRRIPGSATLNCEIVIDTEGGISGSLVDFWTHVAQTRLTSRGRLVIQGYPALFAPSNDWGLRERFRCHGITRGDANMLGRTAEYFDDAFRRGVDAANERLGESVVLYSSAVDLYRTGGHSLCGSGDDWINGMITLSRNGPLYEADLVGIRQVGLRSVLQYRMRPLGAFHPTRDGHEAEARQVAAILATVGLRSSALPVPSTMSVSPLGECAPCREVIHVDLDNSGTDDAIVLDFEPSENLEHSLHLTIIDGGTGSETSATLDFSTVNASVVGVADVVRTAGNGAVVAVWTGRIAGSRSAHAWLLADGQLTAFEEASRLFSIATGSDVSHEWGCAVWGDEPVFVYRTVEKISVEGEFNVETSFFDLSDGSADRLESTTERIRGSGDAVWDLDLAPLPDCALSE